MKQDGVDAWLFGRTTGGIRWGLERTQELLAGVGDPHRRFCSLLIGGTNGKGSVAALCEAALRAGALPSGRVGLYTSPHLIQFAERIRVDGRPIRPELLRAAAERLRPAIERTGASFFEATTAIAFLCFAEACVDTAVVEVGLGGRLDATNVLSPVATAVTNIARDHAEFLGDTPEEIAREKAGIFKPGVPAITAETAPAPLTVLREYAAGVGAPFRTLDEAVRPERISSDADGSTIFFDSEWWGRGTLRIPLVGAHQVQNALLALELLALLPPAIRPARNAVCDGFAHVRWPGRLQREKICGTTWLFDVAHNAAGVQALVAALDTLKLPRPMVLLVGILSDKDWAAMLPPLLTRADACVLTVAPSAPVDRRWDPEGVAARLEAPVPVRVISDFAAALHRAATLAPHGTVLVTGSVHTVGDAMAELGITS